MLECPGDGGSSLFSSFPQSFQPECSAAMPPV
ncbi:hypothetical protein RHECNPAF_850074 [Rhizobium etli CNPAF512]|nr:hypothetical protein RHECNPAF_850074 [Rhizobium etli CNPAF512]